MSSWGKSPKSYMPAERKMGTLFLENMKKHGNSKGSSIAVRLEINHRTFY